MKWRVHFFDANGDETRSLVVEAMNAEEAETKAEDEANKRGWPASFKISDAEALDNE